MNAVQMLAPEVYQTALRQRFERVAHQLKAWHPDARIEAVGASAVPGAWSKGDLDLALIVHQADVAAVCAQLQDRGYRLKHGTLQTDALRMLEWTPEHDAHAVQLVAAGSVFERLFIAFRDRLRCDPPTLQAYNALKREAAAQGEVEYRRRKSAFIGAQLAADPATADIPRRLDETAVWQAEQAVWQALQAGDAQADRSLLAADFLGVYAQGWGDREAHAAPLTQGPRVAQWQLGEPRFLVLDADCLLLSYEARWQRATSSPTASTASTAPVGERTWVSSVWQRQADGRWLNRFSQDTQAVG